MEAEVVKLESEIIEEVAKAIWSVWASEKNVPDTWEDIVFYGHSDVRIARLEAIAAIEKISAISGIDYNRLTSHQF